MSKFKKYKELTELCYPNPPRDFFTKIMKTKDKYNGKIHYVAIRDKIIGGALVFELGKSIYGISGVVIHPEFQGKGFGNKLMREIHNMNKGMFLVSVNEELKNFYTRLGYKNLDDKGNKILMYYLNDKSNFYF